MQKRLILALLALSSLPLQAQDAPPPATGTTASRADLPMILLFTPHGDPKQKDDPNLLVANALTRAIIFAGQHRLFTYRADNPNVKRALTERRLSPAELAKPELTPETRHTLARIYGAQYTLQLSATKVPEGIKTSAQFQVFANADRSAGIAGS